MSITPAVVRTHISSGDLAPLYLLQGEDEAEKIALAHEFEEAIPEEVRPFNVERIYGHESSASLASVLDATRTFPLMATRRIVLVLQADKLLAPRRESERTARDLEAFERYIVKADAHATLVLVAADLDRRRRTTTLLLKHAVEVKCGGVETPADAERFVRARLAEAAVEAEPSVVRLLASRGGLDVRRLRADAERVALFVGPAKRVTTADVREVVGPATSQDDWGVTNAIEQGAAGAALREVALLLDAGTPPLVILGQLGWFARAKVPPGRARAAVEAVFRTDVDLKSSGGEPRVLLERLVVELSALRSAQAAVGRASSRFTKRDL